MKEKLLTIQEAAKILKVSTKTLRRWDESGKFSPERTSGNQRRYRLSQVMELNNPQTKAKKSTKAAVSAPVITPETASVMESAVIETEAAVPIQEASEVVPQPTAQRVTVEESDAPLSIFDQIKADREKALSAPLMQNDQPFVPVPAEMPQSSSVWPKVSADPVDFPKKEIEEEPRKISKHIIMPHNISYQHVFVTGIIAAFLFTSSVMAGYAYKSNTKKSDLAIASTQRVLSAQDVTSKYLLRVNVPGIFGKKVTFLDDAVIKKNLEVSGLSNLNGGVETHGANINAGKGKVTGSNLVYSIVAGSNITVSGDPQNPTIAADLGGIKELIKPGVTSLQGQKGDVMFTAGNGMKVDGTQITNDGVLAVQGQKGDITFGGGAGISLNGLEIVNTGVLSVQGQKGDVAFTAGNGITIDGTTISAVAQKAFNSFTVGGTVISPDTAEDTFTFVAGNGLSITPDTGGKSITIDVEGIPGQWSNGANNAIYYNIGNVGVGTQTPAYPFDVAGTARIATLLVSGDSTVSGNSVVSGNSQVIGNMTVGGSLTLSGMSDGVVHSASGILTTSLVNLSNEVTNILSVTHGGTGISTVPAIGQILIGNGTGYNLGTVTAGAGIGVTSGANSISVTNNGVLSLTGTANQISPSASTGHITLSLPQNIHTAANPTFASLSLTTNTNQLILGTGNTGVITLATLNDDRTYTLPDRSGEICLSSGNCLGGGTGGILGSGNTGYIPKFTGGDTIGDSSIYDNGKVGIGTTSPEGLFSVSGTGGTNALVTLNETGSQNILTGSASGTTRFVFDNTGNLGIYGGSYMIDGVAALTSTALGNNVVSSQLTSVGVLTDGSIAPGFGPIETTSTIQGTNITATGGTGFTSTGAGAGLTFSGLDNHIISASSGNLQIGHAQFIGDINMNNYSISNAQNLTADGVVTFGGLTTNGGILYTDATGVVKQMAQGTDGQVLIGHTGGAATFTTLWGDITLNASGAATITSDSVTLGTDTIGSYISNVNAGSGLVVSGSLGEGWTPSLELGNLQEDWVQSAAYNIVLAHADSSLKIMESAGNTYYGTMNVGDLDADRTYTFPNADGTVCIQELGNCGGGSSGSNWQLNSGVLAPATTSNRVVLGGNITTNAMFEVSGSRPADPLVILNETGTQNILVGQASGVNKFVFSRDGNLSLYGGVYQIDGTTVLSASSLGSNVLESSLTKVGALSSGSITSTFGPISTNSTIQGTNITATGTTGFTASGANAGLTFTNITGPHIISATNGGLQINAFTLGGDITGNAKQISGLGGLSSAGTIRFNDLPEGIVKSDSTGTLTSSAINLSSTEVTNILPVSKGGTGQNFSTAATGSLPYFTGTGVLGLLTPNNDGYILTTHGANNAPTWEPSSSLGTNYWDRDAANGTLFSKTITDDLLMGGNTAATAKLAIDGATGDISSKGKIVFTNASSIETTGNAVLTLGGATTGDIYLTPQNGSGTVSVQGDMSLAAGKAYQIDGASVLNSNTLGGSVIYSTLSKVGALSDGSIAEGFGPIYTSSTIRGTDITAAGSTGFTSTGANAGLTFTGGGTNTIMASNSGTLVIGAHTLGGNVAGGGYSISSLGSLSVTGQVQFSNVVGGNIVRVNESGVLSAGSVNLASDDVSGTLPFSKGGTGNTAIGGAGTVAYSNGSMLSYSAVGNTGQVLTSGGTGVPVWKNPEDLGVNYWGRDTMSNILYTRNLLDGMFIGGNSTASAKLYIDGTTGAVTSKSTVTGTQLVSTIAQGTAPLAVTSNTLVTNLNADRLDGQEGSFYQNASNLNAGTVDTARISGSYTGITGVGALTAGSIGGSFGAITTGSTIQGTNITATGTTGFTASGAGADLLFSGTGVHTISTSSGTLTIGGFALGGDISGSNYNIRGINNLSATGGITFSSLSAGGIVRANTSGGLSVGSINLATSDVSGLLPMSRGGTGVDLSAATHGSLFYKNASGVLQALAPGNAGEVLRTNGTGADPDWVAASGIGTNYWNQMNGGLSPITLSNSLFIGGNSSSSAALTLDGATGQIQSTGNVVINPNGGTGKLQVSGLVNCNTIDTNANGELVCGTDDGGSGSGSSINIQNNGSTIGLMDTVNFSSDFLVQAGPATTANVSIADNVLNFSELSNSLSLDSATGIALGNYDFTIGNGSGTGGLNVNVNGGGDAALIINKTGTGDIFTASSGGTPRFTINNTGAVTAGTWNGSTIGMQYGGTGANLSSAANGTLFVMNGGSMTPLGQGNNLQILQSGGAGTAPTWVDASTLGTNYWNRDTTNGALYAKTLTDDLWMGGNTAATATLTIDGATGALVSKSTVTGTRLISTIASGTAPLSVASNTLVTNLNADLLDGQEGSFYQNASNLNAGTVDTARISGSYTGITGVGALTAGSIGGSFGAITTGSTIQGTNITATGTTGFTASGAGADLTFSGGGTNSISAINGGTLQLGAFSLGGNVTGGNYDITGLNNLSAGGTVTFSGLTSGGFVKAAAGSGQLSVASAVNLSNADVTGTLPVSKGGTGTTTLGPAGSVAYSDTTNNKLGYTLTGVAGQVLVSGGNSTPTWEDLSTLTSNYWQRDTINGTLAPSTTTDDLLIGGNTAGTAKLAIDGATGDILSAGKITFSTAASIETTGTQTLTLGGATTGNISLIPQNGAGRVNVSGDVNLSLGKSYYINNTKVLSAGVLESSITKSSLQEVGTLSVGSLTTGFGPINITSDITGNNIYASGSAGFVASGTNAKLSFSGGGLNIIESTNGGTLQIGGFTLLGDIAGGNHNLTGINNFSAGGTITFGALGTGILKNTSGGNVSVGLVNLGSEVSGTLPVARGGTGNTTLGPAGSVAYSDGSAYTFTASGSANQVLSVNGTTGLPEWRDAASVGTNFWQRDDTYDTVAPANIGDSLVIGGNTFPTSTFSITASTGTASTSGALVFAGVNGVQSVNHQTLQIGGGQTGNINLNPLGGTGTVMSTGNMNLAVNKTYQINGKTVLSETALGNEVVSSQLTSVGTLTGGQIQGSFGAISTSNAIQGSVITASGSTGYIASGDGAGLKFSGPGNHLIWAENGTLQLEDFTLMGNITGNGNDITGLRNFASTGSVTFEGLSGTGTIVKIGAGGTLSKGSIDLNADVSGMLSLDNGGTGASLSAAPDYSIFYKSGSGLVQLSPGTSGQILQTGGASSAPSWTEATALGTNYWHEINGGLSALNAANNLYIGGSSTASAQFTVNAGNGSILFGSNATSISTTGNADLTIGSVSNGNITLDPHGTGSKVFSTGSIDLSTGADYQINHASVLSADTLGDSVINSTLTKVGTLTSGQIGIGFGAISTNSTIRGTTITSNGSGFIADAAAAKLEFSGSGTHVISATGGTLQLGAFTLGGDITGTNTYSLTGVKNFANNGTVNFSGLTGTGNVLKIDGTGSVTKGTVSLTSASDISGILPLASGGTGASLNGTGLQGAVPFISSTGVMKLTGLGSLGQVLTSNGANADLSWTNASALGTNYWQLNEGAIAPKDVWNSLLVGSASTASAKFAVDGMTGNVTTVGTLTVGGGTIQTGSTTTNLTIGGAQTGNITLTPNNGTGSVTITGLGTGSIVRNSSGILSSGSVGLNSADTSGILPTAKGGTGSDWSSVGRGSIPFFNGTGTMSTLAPSTDGWVLTTKGAGQDPVWTSAVGLGTNYWQRNGNLIAPLSVTDTFLVGGSTLVASKFSVDGVSGNVASSGTLTLGGGAIQTGSSSTNLTIGGAQTGNITLSPNNGAGTISVTSWGTGIVKSTGGQLSVGSVDLGSAEVSNLLSMNKGGTGADLSAAAQGSIFYRGLAAMTALAPGGNGQLLQYDTSTNAPKWVSASSVGTNFWNVLNNGVSPIDVSNNLYIGGISTASAKFQVIAATGTASTSGNLVFTGGGSKVNLLNGASLGYYTSPSGDAGLSSTPSLYLANTNQVGIGTTTFINGTVSLQVANTTAADQAPVVAFGDASSANRYQFLADRGSGAVFSMNSANSAVRSSGTLSLQTNNSTTSRLFIDASGNVGIGTTSPKALFDVNGAASVSGVLTVNSGSIQTSANSTLTLGGDKTGNIVLNPLNGVGNVSINNIGSCSKLYAVSGVITCGSDAGGSGTAGVINVQSNGSAVGNNVDTLNFNTKFALSGAANVITIALANDAIDYSDISDSPTLDNNLTNNLGSYNYVFGSGSDTGNVQINLNTSSAALNIANAGTGALINATNKFSVTNAGSLNIGAGQGIDTITAGALNIGTGTNQSSLNIGKTSSATALNGSTLTLTTGASGAITFRPAGTTSLALASDGSVSLGAGSTNNITLSNSSYQNCGMLSTTGTGLVQCTNVPTGVNYWQMAPLGGALSPFSDSLDFLVGANATASAKFAVSNGSSNPTVAVKGSTTNAAMLIDNAGSGDLLRVSKSGTTRFTINNAGDILLNGTTRLTNAGVGTFINGTSIGNLSFGANTITNSQALTLSSGTNALTLQGASGGQINFFGTSNNITNAGNLTLAGAVNANSATITNNLTVSNGNIAVNTGTITVPNFNSIVTTAPSNQVINTNNVAIAQSPIAGILWHDLLAFNKTVAPTFETSTNQGGAWSAGTLNSDLFAQKEDQAVSVMDGTTTNGARWTWNHSDFGWSRGAWMVIGFTWTSTAANKTILIESSADGSAWTTRHSSSGNTTTAEPVWFSVNEYGGDPHIRLTIISTNAQPVELSSIRLLSSRWGDQGRGSELSYPYTWDANQNLGIGGATAGTGVLNIGGNTTTAAGGVYFNGDTSLYRSGSNALTTGGAFTAASLTSTGGLTLGSVTNCSSLSTNGSGVVACGSAPTAENYWQVNTGAIAPADTANDFLIGSNATASAKFAVSNGTSTPTVNINTTTAQSALNVTQSGAGNIFTAMNGATTRFSISATGSVNIPGLTASRVVFTDASKNLVTTGNSAALLNALSDETGTGVAVFGTSPSITTSLLTGSTTFSLINATATTVNFAGAATALTMGASGGTLTVGNGGTYTVTTSSNGNLTVAPNGTGTLVLGGATNTNIQLAKSTLANCTALTTSGGNIGCSTVPLSANLWSRSGTNLSPATAGDSVYLSGSSKLGVNVDPSTMTTGVASFNGNVGVGVTSPAYPLDVYGTSNPLAWFKTASGTDSTIRLDTSAANNAFVRFANNGTDQWTLGNNGASNNFFINNSSGTTAMQISNGSNNVYIYPAGGGNLGIGTSSPRSQLDLGEDGAVLTLGGVTNGGQINFGSNTGSNSIRFKNNEFGFYTTQTNGFVLYGDGTARFTLAKNGDVTLGGAKYTAGCERLYTDVTTGALQCGTLPTGGGGISSVTDGTNTVADATSLAFNTYFTVGGTTPNATLTLKDDSINLDKIASALSLDETTTMALGGNNLILGNGSGVGNVQINTASTSTPSLSVNNAATGGDLFLVSQAGNAKLTINNAGRVGIGAPPDASSLLYVNGNAKAVTFTSTQATGTAPFAVSSTTAVTNLNADMLDGLHSSSFATATQMSNAFIQNGNNFGATAVLGTNTAYNLVLETNGTTRMTLDTGGRVGIGMTPAATLDVTGQNGTQPVVRLSGTTSASALDINQAGTGSTFIAKKSGTAQFEIKNSGQVVIGSSGSNGLTIDPANGLNTAYGGTARLYKTIVYSPEFPGAAISAWGSGTINGSMTSDVDTAAPYNTYYEWTSSIGSLQDYSVAFRVTLPSDFAGWDTTGITYFIRTSNITNTNNKIDLTINNAAGTAVYTGSGLVSTTANTWRQIDVASGSLANWVTAGQTAIIRIKMSALSNNTVRMGDIELKYRAKF